MISVLLAILTPSLAMVRETARKVRCISNQRQIGMGMAMFRDASRLQEYPPSVYAAKFQNDPDALPQAMMQLRRNNIRQWDGIGLLYSQEYLRAEGVFFCPSHHGQHAQTRYENVWSAELGSIFGNYQYRGDVNSAPNLVPGGVTPRTVLLADGMASQPDFNHVTGSNILLADNSVQWYQDSARRIFNSLPTEMLVGQADGRVQDAWNLMDADGRVSAGGP